MSELKENETFKRYVNEKTCKDPDQVCRMALQAMLAESADEFKQVIFLMFLPDMSYDRGDVNLALKVGHRVRGWEYH